MRDYLKEISEHLMLPAPSKEHIATLLRAFGCSVCANLSSVWGQPATLAELRKYEYDALFIENNAADIDSVKKLLADRAYISRTHSIEANGF